MKNNQSGAVMFFALIAMLALGGVASAMLIGSMMSLQGANNYRNRLESYYAADGLVTKLAQIVIDGQMATIRQYCPNDTAGTGIDTVGPYLVRYNVKVADVDRTRYAISVKSFKGGARAADSLFPTSLNQDIQRFRMSGWVATPTDSVSIPVTFYDFRYGRRSPDFGNEGFNEVYASCPGVIKGMIDTVLDADRKPKPKVLPSNSAYWGAANCFRGFIYRRDYRLWGTPTATFWHPNTLTWSTQSCLGECGAHWYNPGVDSCTEPTKTGVTYYPWGFPRRSDQSRCYAWVWDSLYQKYDCDSCKAAYPKWFFTSHIGQWYRPSGVSAAVTYNPTTGRWAGLGMKFKAVGGDTMWFGNNYDPALIPSLPDCDTPDALLYPRETDSMENLVFHDSLKFWRNAYYVDSAKATGKVDSLDPRFNFYRYPYHFYWENSVSDPRWDSKHMGTTAGEFWNAGQFNPLKDRGFRDDNSRSPDNSGRETNHWCGTGSHWNYGWTMEMHTKFVYMYGKQQAFKMEANIWVGDLWVFVNNKLWLDFGQCAGSAYYAGLLDSSASKLGLQSDSVYNLDVFYANQLNYTLMNIETNLFAWRPAKVQQRFWRRDYGPLD
jgi:fibro-slime domain-containing protein